MIRRLLITLCACAALIGLAMPAHAAAKCGNGGQIAGTVLGGIAGGLLGRSIDSSNSKVAGTLIGGALGALVGNQLGKALDKCEQEQMARATKSALDAPAPAAGAEATTQQWQSETHDDVGGSVTAAPPQTTSDGKVCRNVTRVNYVDGKEMQDNPRFCRTPPNSAWVMS